MVLHEEKKAEFYHNAGQYIRNIQISLKGIERTAP